MRLTKVTGKSEKDATLQLNTNFFGPLYTLQAALPVMRAQKSGTIVNISSGAARDPLAACSLYAASKAALEAASEALAHEVAPHGIRVLIVEFGNFRTNFVSAVSSATKPVYSFRPPFANALRAQLSDASGDADKVSPHYDNPVGIVMRKFLSIHGKQMGDPERGVDRVFEAVTGEGLAGQVTGKVTRLVLGKDCFDRMKKVSEKSLAELSLQEEISKSTAFPE